MFQEVGLAAGGVSTKGVKENMSIAGVMLQLQYQLEAIW